MCSNRRSAGCSWVRVVSCWSSSIQVNNTVFYLTFKLPFQNFIFVRLWIFVLVFFSSASIFLVFIHFSFFWTSLYRPNRYIAITTLAIAVFLEYLRQLLIDLHQIYRHSSVPKNTSPCIFFSFLAPAVSEHGAAATFFCHVVPVTV